MTAVQMRRAAREARKLASLIIEGRAPKMDPEDWTLCACGWIARAVGVPGRDGYVVEQAAWPGANVFSLAGSQYPPALVSAGLLFHGPDGAVFPLLAMADALNTAARSAP